jgi:hypothetical protein
LTSLGFFAGVALTGEEDVGVILVGGDLSSERIPMC